MDESQNQAYCWENMVFKLISYYYDKLIKLSWILLKCSDTCEDRHFCSSCQWFVRRACAVFSHLRDLC